MTLSKKVTLALASILLLCLAYGMSGGESSAEDIKKTDTANSDPELKRAQREVRMLDDIYKNGIVAITTHYVNDEEMIPAGTAFKMIFAAAEKNGWHKVRLVDATGEPINEVNSPEDKFEHSAMKQLVAGESWVEEVETRQGTKHLRVATAIPVVMEKCVMCHGHYEDVPKGQAIGALTYTLPLDGPLVPNVKSASGKK